MHQLISSFVLVASLVWPISGLTQERSASEAISKADRDFAVIETVLRDLLAYKNSPLLDKDNPERKIFFSRDAVKSSISAAGMMSGMGYYSQIWDKLSPAQIGSATEAVEDLVSRREDKEPFKGFKPSSSRIVVTEKERPKEFGSQKFWADTPGYSKDGSVAIVRMSFSNAYGDHGGACTYLVVKFRSAWIVLFRAFIYYG